MKSLGNINDIFDVLIGEKPQHIVILPHVRTDPDALGSSYGFAQLALQLGGQPRIIVDEKPSRHKFIYQDFPIENFSETLCQKMEKPDLFVFIDHHSIERLNQREKLLENFPATNILMIDHHLIEESSKKEFYEKINTNERQAKAWIDSSRSSASELVAELFVNKDIYNPNITLNKNISTALLAGIYGDTGGLRFSNSNKRTFEICASLKLDDVKIDKISDKLFGEKSLNQLQLYGEIYRRANLNEKGNLIWFAVTPELLSKYQCEQDDLEGLSSEMRNVENIDLAILIRQISEHDIRVNLRSNEKINVADLASEFGGGGHARAAGITYKDKKTLEDFTDELLAKAERILND